MRITCFILLGIAYVAISLLCINNLYAEKPEVGPEYKASNILGFAKYLVSKEEYYRAYVELLRLKSYYPGYISSDTIYVSELFLLYKGGQFDAVFEKKQGYVDKSLYSIDALYKTDILLNNSDFLKVSGLLETHFDQWEKSKVNFYLYKRLFLAYLLQDEIKKAENLLKNGLIIETNDIKYNDLIKYTIEHTDTYKEPFYAAGFGIIPGLGYIYSDQKETGIITFFLISILSTLTYYSFETDNKPIGIFLGAVTGFFYTGSIIGGYMAAKRYNRLNSGMLKDYLFDKMELEQDRALIYNEYGIGDGR